MVGQVFFALPGKVMRLKPIAFDRQVAFLVRNLKMEEAFTLLDSTTEESRKVRLRGDGVATTPACACLAVGPRLTRSCAPLLLARRAACGLGGHGAA